MTPREICGIVVPVRYVGEFPSGQRGQTVNLLSLTSVVRIHLPPPAKRALCNAQGSFCNEAFPYGNIKQPSAMKTHALMKCAYGTIRNALLHKFAKRICIMAAKPPLHICGANASLSFLQSRNITKN